MSDQPAFAIDDVGIAALPDLEPRDHIPDQFQIDLGDRDAGIASGAGHRQGHIRLGFLAEIDRAEPDPVLSCFDKARRLGIILLAADDIYRQPRHLELLLAVVVELDQLGDRRHLAQQTHIIEATLFERSRCPLRRRRPTELTLDLVDEFLDAPRRRGGLLLLNAKQRRLVLFVAEPEIERAVEQQHEADQPDDQQHIFAEQPPARANRRRLILMRVPRPERPEPAEHEPTGG